MDPLGGGLDPLRRNPWRMLILTRTDTEGLLALDVCIAAVTEAFRSHGEGEALTGSRRHVPAPGGGFHVAIGGTPELLSVKVNGHFAPAEEGGRSRMGGAIYLADATSGEPVALVDSRAVTLVRTAAATAVAVRYLAQPGARTALLVGAGRQARGQIEALQLSMSPGHLSVWDRHPERATEAVEFARSLGIDAVAVDEIGPAARSSDVIVTATPARGPILDDADVPPGALVVALGADQPGKQELDPALLVRAKVVVDITEQCATSGELAGAIQAGLMTVDDVHAGLGEVVAGIKPGRADAAETFVFDSTGTGLQDAAAARVIVDAARRLGRGVEIQLAG
jgi:alanine dehydrogenase